MKYGWRPDLPDVRDHLFARKRPLFLTQLPPKVDLRAGCSPVEHQGTVGSCTANAAVSCLEFLEKKYNAEKYTDLSRLFLYYFSRVAIRMAEVDSGATLRDTIKVLAKMGTPHEASWPYAQHKWNVKPPSTLYPEAKLHIIRDYQRIESLNEMKACLAMGYPFIFGFTVYDSFESDEVARTGVMGMPGPDERTLGGHAVCAVGYDDSKKQFIVRNSWGEGWGQNGYFMMPYDFITNSNLTADFWTIRR